MLKAQQVITKRKDMETEFAPYADLRNRVRHWFSPNTSDFISKEGEGGEKNAHIHNQHHRIAAEKLSNIFYSTMMPVHEQFFGLTPTADASEDLKKAFTTAVEILSQKFGSSNLSTSAKEAFRNNIYFGDACTYPTYEDGNLHFKTFSPTTLRITRDFNDKVCGVSFTKMASALGLVEQFGEKNVSSDTLEKSRLDKQPKNIEVIYLFNRAKEEREETDEKGKKVKTMEFVWRLYIVETKKKKMLNDYVFETDPLMFQTGEKGSDEAYPRSIAMDSLLSVVDLQDVEGDLRRATKKSIDPVIAMPYDASAQSLDLAYDTDESGIVEFMVDASGAMQVPQVLNLAGDIQVGDYQVNKDEAHIDSIFMIDVLTAVMRTAEQATATQIEYINAEKLDVVVPIVVRILNEYVKPIVTRSLHLLVKNGEIEFPEDIDVLKFDVDVNSSLMLRLKQLKLDASLATVTKIEGLAQIDPAARDVFNAEELAKEIIISSPTPSSAIRTGTELEKYREKRAQAQAKAEEQMMNQQVLDNASKNIDPNKKPETGSAMEMMTHV